MAYISKALCYKLNQAKVYNAGTPQERTCDTFLERYITAQTLEELNTTVNSMNEKVNDRIYFLKEQENIF